MVAKSRLIPESPAQHLRTLKKAQVNAGTLYKMLSRTKVVPSSAHGCAVPGGLSTSPKESEDCVTAVSLGSNATLPPQSLW